MAEGTCILFGVLVDVITGIWIYLARDLPFPTLANAMFFPTIISLCFVNSWADYLVQISGFNQIVDSLFYFALAVPLALSMVLICVVIDLLFGWGIRTSFKEESLHGHNKVFLSAFLRASGEEIGWRCYMLPCLMSHYSPFVALLISGIIWGLFHVPVLILLTTKLRPPKPYVSVFIQCLSCILSAFPHGWIAVKSGYSFWASSMLHTAWNIINPTMLGSIYTQTPGYIEGEQWLINGEGLAGCLTMLPIAVFVIWDLSVY